MELKIKIDYEEDIKPCFEDTMLEKLVRGIYKMPKSKKGIIERINKTVAYAKKLQEELDEDLCEAMCNADSDLQSLSDMFCQAEFNLNDSTNPRDYVRITLLTQIFVCCTENLTLVCNFEKQAEECLEHLAKMGDF